MSDLVFERLALANLLRRSAACLRAAVDATEVAAVYVALLEVADARDQLCTRILERYTIIVEGDVVEPAELDDAFRCALAGLEALLEFVARTDKSLTELLEDISDTALDHDLVRAILDTRDRLDAALWRVLHSDDGLDKGLHQKGIGGQDQRRGSSRDVAPTYRVWFGTDRLLVERKGVLTGFSGHRANTVTYGHCDVTIPKTHRVGLTGSPWWRRILHGDDRLRVAGLNAMERDRFWEDVRRQLADKDPRDAIVFIHGYNVSFEEAALQTAQIGADLDVQGAMAFYSWPSRGRLLGYMNDEASIEASESHIARFLGDFVVQSGAARVHVIAHSMGNRGLLRAVNRIVTGAALRTGKPFGQIILAAPDVDTAVFQGLAAAYRDAAQRTTLYVSASDLAVRASRLIHGAARVGFTPPIAIYPGIETVNVTNVDLTLLGHGYVSNCRNVLIDMQALLRRNEAPDQREMLRPCQTDTGSPYWEIKA